MNFLPSQHAVTLMRRAAHLAHRGVLVFFRNELLRPLTLVTSVCEHGQWAGCSLDVDGGGVLVPGSVYNPAGWDSGPPRTVRPREALGWQKTRAGP